MNMLNKRCICTTSPLNYIIRATRLRVVDNSALGKQAMLEGKPPYCFHIYNKIGKGSLGDKVMMAIKGKKKKGIIVGMRLRQPAGTPRYDSNNVVLIDDGGNPLGTRILVPIPNMLRDSSRGLSKLIAIATKFV